MNNKKFALIILDGWGKGIKKEYDAIEKADTPFFDSLMKNYPNAELKTYGEYVGLPDGQMGNSEVGHMNIGAGHIIYQDLVLINKAVLNGDLEKRQAIQELISYAKKKNKPVHLLGLLSDGGVHSHIDHLLGLIDIFDKNGISTFVHAFMDGRDTDPRSGIGYMQTLADKIRENSLSKIATISGRFYAMDRDKRWERIKLAYDALVNGSGETDTDAVEAVKKSYDNNITDEFIKPVVLQNNDGHAVGTIKEGDAVLFFNFRSDRPREMTTVLTQKDFPEFGMKKLDLYFVTMTNYDEEFRNIHMVYDKDNLNNTLGEVISRTGRKQLRIAETEKYAHVTFFFSGGREEEFKNEKRILIPSPKVATYDLKPEMSCFEVTDAVINEIENERPDLIVLNFANGDMVGHTGDFSAAVKAAEAVDHNLSRLVPKALDNDYMIMITADHGNADNMINPDGTPNTAHSLNPVPVILISNEAQKYKIKNGKLADLAPTILKLMEIDAPAEMDGETIIE
ncbi:MAG: 2,3-bisphosphoglycerate-independent phosphoglycerate mutase [Saprospiraceae bacterium]|nr:2,3-bisphosphoglycerate-independent phosphoglycerate mutase [Saprospiraceae bacterium]